jgi:hypothetical protein
VGRVRLGVRCEGTDNRESNRNQAPSSAVSLGEGGGAQGQVPPMRAPSTKPPTRGGWRQGSKDEPVGLDGSQPGTQLGATVKQQVGGIKRFVY